MFKDLHDSVVLGESPLELDAALFVFTKNNLSSVADTTIGKEVDQIDLVPTASLLLDIPIPFSNLGRVIESLMPESIRNKAVYLNAIQILRYAQEYTGGMDVTAQVRLCIHKFPFNFVLQCLKYIHFVT